jgi:hypothetical protein
VNKGDSVEFRLKASLKITAYLAPIFIGVLVVPSPASADACDILAGKGKAAPSCRAKATSMGGTIFGNWIRTKPETATQPSLGKKGYFSSAMTPAIGTLGVPNYGNPRLSISCFIGERAMNLEALPYMLGFANGNHKVFDLTFKIDSKPEFIETWSLDLKRAELQAPVGSRLATSLQGARDLLITTKGIVGRKSPVGYVFKVEGFDKVNALLCK